MTDTPFQSDAERMAYEDCGAVVAYSDPDGFPTLDGCHVCARCRHSVGGLVHIGDRGWGDSVYDDGCAVIDDFEDDYDGDGDCPMFEPWTNAEIVERYRMEDRYWEECE